MVTRRVVARGVRFSVRGGSRRGTERIQSALFRDAAGPGCAFPSRRGHRMRLSVECAFPYLRKRGAVSRKSTLWVGSLTEKRILEGWGHGKAHCDPATHGKAHSAILRSCKLHFSVTLPPRRPGVQPPARLRGTIKSGSTGQMRSSNRPSGCGAVCSRICKFGLEFDFTKSRSLGAQLGCAVWMRSLGRWSYGKAHPRSGRDTISSPMAIPVRVYEERQEV